MSNEQIINNGLNWTRKLNENQTFSKEVVLLYMEKARKEAIRQFCEQVNNLACENMLQPPHKLEGQHKRAMVILAKQMGIDLSFQDEVGK